MIRKIELNPNHISDQLYKQYLDSIKQLTFATEWLDHIRCEIEKAGITIVEDKFTERDKNTHPFKPFYMIDIGWCEIIFYTEQYLFGFGKEIYVEITIKDILSFTTDDRTEHTPMPKLCKMMSMFVEHDGEIRCTSYGENSDNEILWEILPSDKTKEIKTISKIIRKQYGSNPPFKKIEMESFIM